MTIYYCNLAAIIYPTEFDRFYDNFSGIVKPEDIHLYSEKDSFLKYLKRKDYFEAMAQIEAAVAEDGITGETPVEAVSDAEKEEEKRGVKRKLSVDSTSSESKAKKAAKSSPVKLGNKPVEAEKLHTGPY